MVAHGRWASLARLLVCRRTSGGVQKIAPWPDRIRPSARDGSSAPRELKTKERGSPDCSTGIRSILSDERGCRTAGCERGFMPWQVANAAPEGKGSFCCGYSEDRCQRKWHSTSVRVQAARLRLGSRDCIAVKLLSTQIVRNRRKQFSSSTTRHVACNVVVNAFQQYERLVNLATAKFERRCTILELAHPPLRETARVHWRFM